MYDFCFTPIYAAILALGGIVGFIMKGSTVSLGAGVGLALILSLMSYFSFTLGYKKKQSCKPAVFASLVISLGLTAHMYQRFAEEGKYYTAFVAFASGMMSAYYVWNLTLFKPNFVEQKKA